MEIPFEWIIEHIPELIMLILPGYLFISSFKFGLMGKNEGTKAISVECVIVSYIAKLIYVQSKRIIKYILEFVCEKASLNRDVIIEIPRKLANNELSDTLIFIGLIVIVGLLFGYLVGTQCFKVIIERVLKVPLFSNPFMDMPNGIKGNFVDVYIKDENLKQFYRGSYNRHFIDNGETWIVIDDYELIDITNAKSIDDKKVIKPFEDKIYDQHPQVLLNLKDVAQIEFLGTELVVNSQKTGKWFSWRKRRKQLKQIKKLLKQYPEATAKITIQGNT